MLKVEGLRKVYPTFTLKDVSFELPEGCIMGFIGKNGAGKTTTIKSMLNYVSPDAGQVTVLGKNILDNETELKQDIGVQLGEMDYYPHSKVKSIANVLRKFFENWDEEAYRKHLKEFNIDDNKRLSELSTGMRVKLGIAFALSHGAKLLILDEPTSGLDPIARDELTASFRKVVEDGVTSILFSTHITSDLDKCADYIIYIRDGEIIVNASKDDVVDDHVLISGNKEDLETYRDKLIGYKENAFGFVGMLKKSDLTPEMSALKIAKPNLEDIMIYYDLELSEGASEEEAAK